MFTLVTTIKNSVLDSIIAPKYNNAYIKVYAGIVPANANSTMDVGVVLLGTLRCSAIAFGSASNGIITANPISGETSADASGIASFYRAYESDGITLISQGLCSTTIGEFILNSTDIVLNGIIECVSLTISI
ncbi:MAG: hypothetical protein JHC33_03315 [Ignisphaera sp.]|nr:hypothetical protein [Ignisphaera sp.]